VEACDRGVSAFDQDHVLRAQQTLVSRTQQILVLVKDIRHCKGAPMAGEERQALLLKTRCPSESGRAVLLEAFQRGIERGSAAHPQRR
jgi:hypothetical protein